MEAVEPISGFEVGGQQYVFSQSNKSILVVMEEGWERVGAP